MKSLIIIWLLVLVTLVGGGVYMNHAINGMLEAIPEAHTSVLTAQTSLEVVNSYGEQKTLDISTIQGSYNESN